MPEVVKAHILDTRQLPNEVLNRYEARWPSSKVQANIIRLLLMTGCRKSAPPYVGIAAGVG